MCCNNNYADNIDNNLLYGKLFAIISQSKLTTLFTTVKSDRAWQMK